MLWFHTAFIHQLGRYLIELNSGRLKVGVKRYREILAQHQAAAGRRPDRPPAPTPAAVGDAAVTAAAHTATGPKPITIAVLGPVKAGKSSLVNALLGQQAATVDTPPGRRTRHALRL